MNMSIQPQYIDKKGKVYVTFLCNAIYRSLISKAEDQKCTRKDEKYKTNIIKYLKAVP
jgi:hypothetical protein